MELDLEIGNMIHEAILTSNIKKKLDEGIELTEEEKEEFLQHIYQSARTHIREGKEITQTKAKLAYKGISIITLLAGEKGKGFHTASKTIGIRAKNNVDHYSRVLKGVDITAKNPITENFKTLLAQYEATDEFEYKFLEYFTLFIERIESYRKDFASPVAPEIAEEMIKKRKEVLELDKKYIKK